MGWRRFRISLGKKRDSWEREKKVISRMIKRFDKDSRDRENRKPEDREAIRKWKEGGLRRRKIRLKMRLLSERFLKLARR